MGKARREGMGIGVGRENWIFPIDIGSKGATHGLEHLPSQARAGHDALQVLKEEKVWRASRLSA